ncbi:MAG: elongation factor Ts [Proteobacteria bacterium]|nr:elongation factor Ts [Pseudomonadota bacterium]
MQITASMVKELRQRTGAGMMDCKKALQEADGEIEAAIEAMRKSGIAKAAKKAGRIAAEGIIAIKQNDDNTEAVLVEVNSETDFVAKDENFLAFVDLVLSVTLANKPADIETLNKLSVAGDTEQSVENARLQLVSKVGENISLRRFERLKAEGENLGAYIHASRIGVLVDLEGGGADLAKDIAMHIAASCPLCITEADVPTEVLQKETEIFIAQAEESGKPAGIIDKMVSGRIKKYLKEVTLLGQPFVKDPDQSIEGLLKANKATVKRFVRFEVGEGIEKKQDNFVEEVMAQAKSQ